LLQYFIVKAVIHQIKTVRCVDAPPISYEINCPTSD